MESATEEEKVVYFVRHGQSIDNASPVFQSVSSPLSETGTRQAKSIADRLSRLSFDLLLASPLERTKQTASYITDKTAKPAEFSELFVERIKPTEIDGKPWTDPVANKIWRNWEESLYTPGTRVSDGENYDDTVARADQALLFLTARPEQSIVVVTHGYFLRAIIARVLLGNNLTGPIMKRFQALASIENTSITVLHYKAAFEEDFAWRLWTYNDHSHFAE